MPFNYNTQGITNPDANDPRNLGGSEGYGNPTASGSSGIMSSTANTTSNDDDNEPSFFESIANLFSGAGADLPSDNNDDGDSGASFYSGPMFGPFNNGSDDSGSDNNSSSTSPLNKPLPTPAADRAVYEALGIDVPEVYRGELGEWEPEPNINVDVLQKALQPDPITVEEIEVKAGDTLSAIAQDKGVPVQDVINANPQIKNPDLIRPGEKVTVPEVYSGESTMERMARESAELAASKRDAAGITRSLTPEEVKQRNAALKAASEDPDRKFYQSTIPMEDRTFAEEAAQTDGIMNKPLTDDDMGLPSGAMFTAKDAQKALGFTGNEVDGKFGPNSRKRLLDFQRKAGIPLTGDFNDPATRAALMNPDSTDPRKVVSIDPSPDLTTSGNIDMDKVTEYIKTAVQNPLKAAGIIGTIRQELGRGAIRTEDMGYRLGKKATANSPATGAYAVFRDSDVDAALANLSSAEQARAKTNVPMNALGQAIMDIKYDGGHQYRGRGLVQITHKDMYKQVGDKIGVDLVENPELVNDPKYAVPAAIALLEIKDYFGKDTTKNNLRSMINPGQSDAKRDARWKYVEAALADIRAN